LAPLQSPVPPGTSCAEPDGAPETALCGNGQRSASAPGYEHPRHANAGEEDPDQRSRDDAADEADRDVEHVSIAAGAPDHLGQPPGEETGENQHRTHVRDVFSYQK